MKCSLSACFLCFLNVKNSPSWDKKGNHTGWILLRLHVGLDVISLLNRRCAAITLGPLHNRIKPAGFLGFRKINLVGSSSINVEESDRDSCCRLLMVIQHICMSQPQVVSHKPAFCSPFFIVAKWISEIWLYLSVTNVPELQK